MIGLVWTNPATGLAMWLVGSETGGYHWEADARRHAVGFASGAEAFEFLEGKRAEGRLTCSPVSSRAL